MNWFLSSFVSLAFGFGVLCCLSDVCVGQSRGARQVVRVVNSETKEPVAEAQVTLQGSGAQVRTSASGIAEVSGLSLGSNRLVVRRLGYGEAEVDVLIDDLNNRDTTTISLAPVPRALPEVVAIRARIGGTYYRQLEVNGFYERMLSRSTRPNAFVTDSQIAKWNPSLLTDVGKRIGRDLGRCMFLVNGMRIRSVGGARTLRQGIDAVVLPGEVAGMEVYRPAELPVQFVNQVQGASCVVLVWLK